MSLVLVKDKQKEIKVKPLFSTVRDLAEIVTVDWGRTNNALLIDCDKVMKYVKDYIEKTVTQTLRTDRVSKYLYKRQLLKHMNNLHSLQVELQILSVEVESFIGSQVFLRAGVKMKLKDKKMFDDKIMENREITVMLIGLLYILLDATYQKDYKFVNELEIMNELTDPTRYSLGYFATTSEFLKIFKFN